MLKKRGLVTSSRHAARRPFATATALLISFAALCAQAQQAAPALPDVQKLGPQVGDRAPDFTLNDQQGASRTLTSLVGPKGLMLVFFRSADW